MSFYIPPGAPPSEPRPETPQARAPTPEPTHAAVADFDDELEDTANDTVVVTFFTDHTATTKREQCLTFNELAQLIHTTAAATKERLPWLKLARFGDQRTEKGSLRHNANLVAISGLEADYDRGEMSLADAKDIVASAGIAALIYPSPSYTPEAPKWRVLCPFSREYPPAERDRFMARLNGLFGSIFSRESWVLAQSYYYGRVGNFDHHASVFIGNPIDLVEQLDAGAIGLPPERGVGRQPHPKSRPEDISEARVRGLIDRLLDNIRHAAEGEKHHTLRDNCLSLGGYQHVIGLPAEELAEQALSALPSADDWDKARDTALWAIRRGMEKPLELEDRPNPHPRRPTGDPGGNSEPPKDWETYNPPFGCDAPPLEAMPGVEPTEDAVATAFAAHQAGLWVHDHTRNCWFVWTGSRWVTDQRNKAFHEARTFSRAVRAAYAKPPKAMTKIAFATAIERAARAEPILAVSHEVWDTDPWLLGTPDGAVDLRTGQLLPPSPDHYISRHTSVVPAPPGTPAPLWQAFLDSATQGDKELRGFLQRFFGYAMTGDVSEEVLTFFFGPGGNGKGVFLAVLSGILSDYVVSVPIEVFTADSRINLEYYRAQMAGARLVTASETEAQATWAEQLIKDITGADALLSGRHPYGKPFTFRSQAKILIIGNYAPKLKGRSPAMERRLRVTPFIHIPPTPDPHLKDKLQAEYPAILRWGIDGCLAWQRERLGFPRAVKVATSAYFEQQDAFHRWIDERCILDKHLTLRPGILLVDFNEWAKANGEEPVSANAFAQLIDRTPELTRVRTNGVRLVQGIGLQPRQSQRWSDDDA